MLQLLFVWYNPRPFSKSEVIGVESQEYSDFKAAPWAREDGEWHHSDFIVVAYYYVTKLFDELVLGNK